MNMADKERGQNTQFLILPSTIIAVVDKETSLHCNNVKMCRTGVTCIFTCSTHFWDVLLSTIAVVEGRMRNCIFCPLSLSPGGVTPLQRVARMTVTTNANNPLLRSISRTFCEI